MLNVLLSYFREISFATVEAMLCGGAVVCASGIHWLGSDSPLPMCSAAVVPGGRAVGAVGVL